MFSHVYFAMKAKDADGNESDLSNVAELFIE
jgi:hypothetical protein